jgi:ankyrin repeat protein
MIAASENQTEVVKILLRAGADIHARDLSDSTALVHAIKKGCVATVKFLLSKPEIYINARYNNNQTALMIAASNREGIRTTFSDPKQTEIVNILLSRNDIYIDAKDENGFTALTIAIKQSFSIEVVDILLRRGAI